MMIRLQYCIVFLSTFAITFCYDGGETFHLIPNCSKEVKWKEVPLSPELCPLEQDLSLSPLRLEHLNFLQLQTPSLHSKGFLCTKVTLVTRCTYYWYFHSSIEHLTETGTINKTECLEAVDEFINRGYGNLDGDFPEPHCVWALETTITFNKKNLFLVQSHDVPVNLYDGSKIDNLFVGGVCRNQFLCRTVHPNTVWVQIDSQTKCPENYTVHGSVKRDKGGNLYITSPLTKPLKIRDLCITEFCGQTTFKTDKGILFFIEDKQIIKKAVPCKDVKKNQVKVLKSTSLEDQSIKVLQEQLDYLNCRVRILETLQNGSLSHRVLKLLAPRSEGIKPVYQLTLDGRLIYATCPYTRGYVKESLTPNFLGVTEEDNLILYPFWVKIGNFTDNSCSAIGPNGIIRTSECKVVYPNEDLDSLIHLLEENEYIVPVRPKLRVPVLPYMETPSPVHVDGKLVELSQTKILSNIQYLILYFRQSIVMWTILAGIILSPVLLCYLWPQLSMLLVLCKNKSIPSKKRIKTHKRQKPREDIELLPW